MLVRDFTEVLGPTHLYTTTAAEELRGLQSMTTNGTCAEGGVGGGGAIVEEVVPPDVVVDQQTR